MWNKEKHLHITREKNKECPSETVVQAMYIIMKNKNVYRLSKIFGCSRQYAHRVIHHSPRPFDRRSDDIKFKAFVEAFALFEAANEETEVM